MASIISACNSDSDSFVSTSNYSDCSVSSFSLVRDDSVIKGLDSVFFSIDLVNAEIFNADSLPMGTKVDKLLISVGTSSASGCNLTYRIPGTNRDTTVSYIDSPKDSINFADGPVKMQIVSYDGLAKRDYTIKVNVHTVATDTLFWDQAARSSLPGNISSPTVQKTVEFDGKVYCLTSDGTRASLASTANPYYNDWTVSDVNLPADADVSSFAASTEAFYITDVTGRLFESADAKTWNQTEAYMNHIYGGYAGTLLGARKDSDGWKYVTYPASTETAVPAEAPVSGTSQVVLYESKWSSLPLAVCVGGRTAAGRLTGATWGYDGEIWSKISLRDIDEREDLALFPYFTLRTVSGFWRVTDRPTLIAVGGRYNSTAGSVVSKSIYVSYDQGLTWDIDTGYLALPDYIPDFAGAQGVVVSTELGQVPRSVDGWTPFAGNRMPVWATPVPFARTSRVSTAVTEWECPFIYLFGGENKAGDLYNTVWRGVIRRFTFKPLY